MPTPPESMTAPVVDDVDAVAFVPVMTPLVVRLVSVPTDVIVGCAAVVTVPAVVADVADVAVAALPLTLPTIVFVTVRFVSVPTVVKLEVTTFEASVVPVRVPAAAAPPPALPLSFCIACRIVSVAATVPAPLT